MNASTQLHVPVPAPCLLFIGRLVEAARTNNDARLLLLIDGDCVALEVRYHKTCYRDYTRDAYSKTSVATKQTEPAPDDAETW